MGAVWKEKKNPFEITISSFVLACLRVKKSQFWKSLELSKFLHHQLLGCVSKARSACREQGAQKSPQGSVPSSVSAAILLQEAIAEASGPPPGPPFLVWKPRLLAPVGQPPSFPCSLPPIAPSWILNLLWFHPLYHLICFLIWSQAAMWLIKGRCELSSSQRSPCIQTNMLIYLFLPAVTFPCSLLPFCTIFILSLCTLPLFTLSFSSLFILICL